MWILRLVSSIAEETHKFFNTQRPLISKRVRIILQNPEDAKRFIECVREAKKGNVVELKLSEETQIKLKREGL